MSTRRIPKTRRRTTDLAPLPDDAVSALRRGPQDEQRDAARGYVLPSAADISRMADFQEAFEMAKADTAQPRRGVAMSQIDLAGDLKPSLTLMRPVGLNFPQLRFIAKNDLLIPLIISTRIAQVKRFLVQPRFKFQPGFEVGFKDKSRPTQDADNERKAWIREYLMSCGAEFDPRRRRALQRDSLPEFTAKHLLDSLSMDAAPIEYVLTRSQRVHGFVQVDGAKVFLTDPNSGLTDEYNGPAEFNELTGRTNFGDPSNIIAVYAQDNEIRAQYSHMDMLYPVRNKTSEEEYYGYGMAEPDTIMRVSRAMLDAFTMNTRNISDNSIPRGFFSILGDYQDEDINSLKASYAAQLRGAANRFRVPFLVGSAEQGAGISFVPTGAQVDDALFSRWMVLLAAITCSSYLIDPAEIAFESFSAGGASSLSGSDTEARLTNSNDKGLHTLLAWYGGTLNEIVQIVDPEMELYWTGLDDTKEDDAQREQTTMKYGEVRERHGLSNEGIAPEVLNAPAGVAGQAYMTVMQQQAQQAQQAQQQAQQGPGQQPSDQDDPENQEAQQPGPDGQDPDEPAGPNGEARYRDHQGSVWQAQGQQNAMAKAYEPNLNAWPEV